MTHQKVLGLLLLGPLAFAVLDPFEEELCLFLQSFLVLLGEVLVLLRQLHLSG